MRRPLQNGIDQLYGRIDTCKNHETAGDKHGEKWTPFWQRGHLLDDRDKNDGHLLKSSSKKIKLFHSSLDISSSNNRRRGKKVTISKSVSVQNGLHHMPPIENIVSSAKRDKRPSRTMTGLNSLALPKIDPDVAIEGERNSRESSAVTGVTFENGLFTGTGESDVDSDSGGEEEVYLSDDDPEVSRKNLEKAGEYIVDHDWILHENLAKEARRMSCVRNQTRIIVPDDDPMEAIQSRLDEVSMMVKPKAEWGNFIDTIEPEQRAKIMVSSLHFSLFLFLYNTCKHIRINRWTNIAIRPRQVEGIFGAHVNKWTWRQRSSCTSALSDPAIWCLSI